MNHRHKIITIKETRLKYLMLLRLSDSDEEEQFWKGMIDDLEELLTTLDIKIIPIYTNTITQ